MTNDKNKKNRIISQIPKRTTSVQWPSAVDAQLNHLVSLAKEEGERVSRSEILAALVADVTIDGHGIGEMVRAYRKSNLADSTGRAGEFEQPSKPGRRKKSDN